MIIDRTRLSGLDAYFQDGAGGVNLATAAPITSKTAPLGAGKQLEIVAIDLLIETSGDLGPLFTFQATPLFRISVNKEMFPTLFVHPFSHRVHNIAGYDDFKRGTLENAKVLDVEGIPTIVSVGTATTLWRSEVYALPEPATFNHASWEFAASRKTPKENFKYDLTLHCTDASGTAMAPVQLAASTDPQAERKKESIGLANVSSYQVEFTCDVKKDAAVYEKHSSLVGQSIGTPLLRAVNLLESVADVYEIHSLQELISLSSEYHLFEVQGQPIQKMTATLDLTATLVSSEYQNNAAGKFEFVQLDLVNTTLSNFQARLVAEALLRPNVK